MSGPKELTKANWLQADPAFSETAGLSVQNCIAIGQALLSMGPGNWNSELGGVPIVTPEQWIEKVSRHKLREHVPSDIRNLFEGAKAMLAFGCFYYSFCTLAMEQFLRVLEASITYKCKTLGGPGETQHLVKKLKWLLDQGVISQNDWYGWDQLRTIRNGTSHPKFQMLMPPALCDHSFELLCKDINDLFATPKVSPSSSP